MKLKSFVIRAWLNKRGRGSTAYVFVDFKGANLDEDHPNGLTLEIADCNRSISLEFATKTNRWENVRNDLAKCHKLMETLEAVESILLQAIQYEESL